MDILSQLEGSDKGIIFPLFSLFCVQKQWVL
jgi:hypothetical protein